MRWFITILKYMLDTNIVIYVMKQNPIEVLDTFNRHAAHLCISIVLLPQNCIMAQKKAAFLNAIYNARKILCRACKFCHMA